METSILVLGIALFIAAAYGDIKTLHIPNALVIVVAVLGVFRFILIGDLTVALYTVSASFVIFIAVFLLFWRGLIGGGDAKLITAAALLIGYQDLLAFLFAMSVCGALVTVAVVITHWRPAGQQLPGKIAVPYGVAIATGGGVTLFFQSSLITSLLG